MGVRVGCSMVSPQHSERWGLQEGAMPSPT